MSWAASLEFELLEKYREWLTQQFNLDNFNRKEGNSAVVRSRDEKAAIFWNLPKKLRRQENLQRRYLGPARFTLRTARKTR